MTLAHKLLSEQECQRLVAASEKLGYEGLGYTGGAVTRRNNTRVIVHDAGLADVLWERLHPVLSETPLHVDDPVTGVRWVAERLNARFRFCRYEPGQFFVTHTDGGAIFTRSELTTHTINIYLNHGFEGGRTLFYLDPARPTAVTLAVRPEAGMCTLFNHATESLPHEAEVLRGGVKYILRTDVVMRPASLGRLSMPSLGAEARLSPLSPRLLLGISLEGIELHMLQHPRSRGLNGYRNCDLISAASAEKGDGLSVCERLQQRGSRFVGRATHFVCWNLGSQLATLIGALEELVAAHGLDRSHTYFWICDFVIRRGTRQLRDADLAALDCFSRPIEHIRHTLFLMDPWGSDAFRRLWSLW